MPKRRDWREGLRKTKDGLAKQMRHDRMVGKATRYDFGEHSMLAIEMRDEDIEHASYVLAVRHTEEAIRRHESEEIQARMKRRAGQAQ